MEISLELLTIKMIFSSSNLLLLLRHRAKHINEIGWSIFIFNLENQPCNPYWCARHGTTWEWTKLSKKGPFLTEVKKWTIYIFEIVFHPQAVPCLAHQYGLQDSFSRLKMKIFHPVSFMCLARYFNSGSNIHFQ